LSLHRREKEERQERRRHEWEQNLTKKEGGMNEDGGYEAPADGGLRRRAEVKRRMTEDSPKKMEKERSPVGGLERRGAVKRSKGCENDRSA
jgi:hypothetical protein